MARLESGVHFKEWFLEGSLEAMGDLQEVLKVILFKLPFPLPEVLLRDGCGWTFWLRILGCPVLVPTAICSLVCVSSG